MTPTGTSLPAAAPDSSVVTAPAGVTMRSAALPVSATRSVDVIASYAMPAVNKTKLKRAAVRVPSTNPDARQAAPPPATVATAPLGATKRIIPFRWSTIHAPPAASSATLTGPKKEASAPTPFAQPTAVEPASVATTPACVTVRTMLLL
jgi:hypothetical protein